VFELATFGERFKELRLIKGLTQEELANDFNKKYHFNFGKSAISQYENDKRIPEIDALRAFADYFQVSLDYLLGRSNNKESNKAKIISDNISEFIPYEVVRLPIVGVIHAGMPVLATENIIGYEFISRELLNPNHEYFFLKVRGDSMNQIIPEDGIVLVQRQPNLENGEIGIILVNGDEGTIKKFYQQGNIVTLVPASTNPQHQPQIYDVTKIEIFIIGKAIKVITNL
jgi:repressor LexA